MIVGFRCLRCGGFWCFCVWWYCDLGMFGTMVVRVIWLVTRYYCCVCWLCLGGLIVLRCLLMIVVYVAVSGWFVVGIRSYCALGCYVSLVLWVLVLWCGVYVLFGGVFVTYVVVYYVLVLCAFCCGLIWLWLLVALRFVC